MSVYVQQVMVLLEHVLIHESWCCLSDWLIMGKGEQEPSYFPLYLQSNRGVRNKGRMQKFLLIHSLLRAFFCDSFIPIFPCTKTTMISFPHELSTMKELTTSCCLLQGQGKKVHDGWCLHTLVCTYSWLFWLGFCFLPWCYCYCVSMLYSALLTYFWGCVASVSAFFAQAECAASVALLSPSQGTCLIEECHSKLIRHFKLSRFCLSCPDKLSAQSDFYTYPKAFPVGSYWCHSYFQVLLTPVSNFWRLGNHPKCLRWVGAK